MNYASRLLISVIIFLLTATTVHHARAQEILNRTITIQAQQRPLGEVMKAVAKQGNFIFSYNSNIIREDSLVTIQARGKTVKQVLEQLFAGNYAYRETGNYIILQPKILGQTWFQISGYVVDKLTGAKISNASVYERQQLISALTNEQGYFKMRLRDRTPVAAISISKDLYGDTSLYIRTGYDQELTVTIAPATYTLKTVEITGQMRVEKTWLGRFFLSSRQRMQSLNLRGFFSDQPYQFSLVPGLGTHGGMGGQVVNKFSFNMIGGYTAGVDGVEVGSIFNIVQKDVEGFQLSGLFNTVGGKTDGVQLAGLYNAGLDSVKGVQIAGFSNLARKHVNGWQISGVASGTNASLTGVQISGALSMAKEQIDGFQLAGVGNIGGHDVDGAQIGGGFNKTTGTVDGMQLSGVGNLTGKNMDGVQIGGAGNIVKDSANGLQLSGIFNYAGHIKGVQLSGAMNIIRGDMDILQFSALANVAGAKMHGTQLSMGGNIAGGDTRGTQLSALFNKAGKDWGGTQFTGGMNIAAGNGDGMQLSALLNTAGENMQGAQLSGLANFSGNNMGGTQVAVLGGNIVKGVMEGPQVSALFNYAGKEVKGAQIAGIFNYTRTLRGVQIGLINVADTSDGFSLGLINIVKKGMHRLSLYATDVLPVNAAYKSGNPGIYSILMLGYQPGSSVHTYSIGYGLGKEFPLKGRLSVITEVTTQTLFWKNFDNSSVLYRLQPSLSVKLGKRIRLFGGPALNVHVYDNDISLKYATYFPGQQYPHFEIGNNALGWLGWQAGINIF